VKLKGIGFALGTIAVVLSFWLFRSQDFNERHSDPLGAPDFRAQGLIIHSNAETGMEPLQRQNQKTSGADEALTKEPLPPSSIRSPLSNDEIQSVFSDYQRQFQNCWIQRLKDQPKLAGKVDFRVRISPRGKISELQITNSEIEDPLMLQCLSSTLNRMSFREFEGEPIEVLFPLDFAL